MFHEEFLSYFNGSLSQTIGEKSFNGFAEVANLNCSTCSTRIVISKRVCRKIALPWFMVGPGFFSNDLPPKTCKVTLRPELCSVPDNS